MKYPLSVYLIAGNEEAYIQRCIESFKPISKEEVELGTISEEKRHKITVKSSYARVSNKKFMKEVAQYTDLDFANGKSFKFKALWSKPDSALVIDLKNKEE